MNILKRKPKGGKKLIDGVSKMAQTFHDLVPLLKEIKSIAKRFYMSLYKVVLAVVEDNLLTFVTFNGALDVDLTENGIKVKVLDENVSTLFIDTQKLKTLDIQLRFSRRLSDKTCIFLSVSLQLDHGELTVRYIVSTNPPNMEWKELDNPEDIEALYKTISEELLNLRDKLLEEVK